MKNTSNGRAVLILYTNDKRTSVSIPSSAQLYLLTADELLTKKMRLNGEELKMTPNDTLPVIKGKNVKKGNIELPAHSVLFLSFVK